MKKTTKRLVLAVLLFLLLLLTGYFILAFYYREGFSVNTWINGVYCTGKTVEEVNSELLLRTEAPNIVIVDREGTEYTISLAEADYQADYSNVLEHYRQEQNPFLWVDNVLFHSRRELSPTVTVDVDGLRRAYDSLEFVRAEQQKNKDYSLARDSSGEYVFTDGLAGRIDLEKAFLALENTVENGQETLNLSDSGCYYDITPNENQKTLRNLWKEIERYQSCDIVYCFGQERHPVTAADCASFLVTENGLPVTDQTGNFVLDEEAVTAYVEQLAEKYDGYGRTRQFHSTRGDVITIEGGTYGSKLDQKKETAYLMEHLLDAGVHTGTQQSHVPTYEREAFCYGRDDIGDTYIEVDMGAQHMWCYKNGALVVDTDVVTGNISKGYNTPSIVAAIQYKTRNAVLKGDNYRTPVNYWMPFYGNYGIHDAYWRAQFGGEVYLTNGSHGCVNTPPAAMAQVYANMESGTPVVLYY